MKCKKCNKLLKENTEGNDKYCQGHSIFDRDEYKLFDDGRVAKKETNPERAKRELHEAVVARRKAPKKVGIDTTTNPKDNNRLDVFNKTCKELKESQKLLEVKTNDLKKGARIRLRNGWYGTIYDNMKGNTRLAEVEGFCTEIGSVYSHDIMSAFVGGEWRPITHTKKQLQCRTMTKAMGF